MATAARTERLTEVALLFLKLGAFSFGGPAAYIAIMHRETVRHRRWLDDQQFLDLVGATNVIPGPNAAEMAMHLGLRRAGWRGFLCAGLLFTLPGVLATLALAWVYVRYASLPSIGWVLYGVKPVVIAIVLQALWDLGRRTARDPVKGLIGTAVVGLYLLGQNEVLLLAGSAAIALGIAAARRQRWHGVPAVAGVPVLGVPLAGTGAATSFSQLALFLSFLKIGSLLYGSGYVLLAFLKSEFVIRLQWLTNEQLLDAIAVGQATPGPVFSSATFVGYLLGSWPGALLATLGIFLPSFLFVALLSRVMHWATSSPWARAFLDGVNAASLGLMAGAAWELARTGVVDAFGAVVALASLLLAVRCRANSVWLIGGGGALGVIYRFATG